jgi:hypothetical protein
MQPLANLGRGKGRQFQMQRGKSVGKNTRIDMGYIKKGTLYLYKFHVCPILFDSNNYSSRLQGAVANTKPLYIEDCIRKQTIMVGCLPELVVSL